MIWHIFLKDARQLWALALIAAFMQGANAATSIILGPFMQPQELRILSALFPYLAMLGLAALIATVVHQEPIPGTDQDWLVRPIQRRDLFAAKLLFVLAIGHGPLFIADLVECLAQGFDLPTALAAALADGASKFFLISLPVMCVAAVTHTFTEMIMGGLALVVCCGIALMLYSLASQTSSPLSQSGLDWIRPVLIAAAFLVLGAIILPLQYLHRRTAVSRQLVVIAAAGFVAAWTLLPWSPSYALQQRIDDHAGRTDPIVLQLDPGTVPKPRAADAPNRPGTGVGEGVAEVVRRARATIDHSGAVPVRIPILISGMGGGDRLFLDRTTFRLIGAHGTPIYTASSQLFSDFSPHIEPEGPTEPGVLRSTQALFVPQSVYLKVQRQSVRLEIDYSITALHAGTPLTLAVNGASVVDAAGYSCIARYDVIDGDVDVGCLTPQKQPSCMGVSLEDGRSGASNPPVQGCALDFAPFRFDLTAPLVRRFGAEMPTFDRLTRTALPVSGALLKTANIVLVPYDARAHYSRHLVVPKINLGEWRSN